LTGMTTCAIVQELNGETAMQQELDIFTPYHRLLDMVTDREDVKPCHEENPALWKAFCKLTNRVHDGPGVWTQRDISDWANMKIKAMQGDE